MSIATSSHNVSLLQKPIPVILMVIFALLSSFLIATKGMELGILMVVLPLSLVFIGGVFINPKWGVVTVLIQGFFVAGLTRYVPFQWGLTIDIVLVLTYLATFFKAFKTRVPWHRANSVMTVLALVWYGYLLFQIVNPEARSIAAWFYVMRGLGLYMLLIIPLVFMYFNKLKDMKVFFIIWGLISMLATLKGIQQFAFGVDAWEQAWLDGGPYKTHVLFGKLRVFSFYPDSGQFGAAQAHTGAVFALLVVYLKKNYPFRFFCLLVSGLGFFGMLMSGTRGAIAVPGAAGIMFLIIRKNIPVLIAGGLLLLSIFVFFKYTNIGQGNAEIARMRTAFDPNDASFQVRLNNQKLFANYLASRPFGGGVGSAGDWGKRFSPNTFLANMPTDSWYVAIWAETGVVGLVIHLFVKFFALIAGAYYAMFRLKNPMLKAFISALTCGMLGIMLASYGNSVWGQLPTAIIMYMGLAFIFLSPRLDKQIAREEHKRMLNLQGNKI